MARPEKVAVVEDVAERLSRTNAAVLTEYRGLSVDDLAELRRRLREEGATYRVVKNTLTRRAADRAGLDIPDEVLTGPTALTFCDGDPVAAAKVLRKFSDERPELVFKASVMEGQLLDAEQTRALADLASREELLSQMAGLMTSVVAKPARLANASLSKMARLLSAYQDKREAAGETSEDATTAS